MRAARPLVSVLARHLANLSLLLCALTAGLWAWTAADRASFTATLLPGPSRLEAHVRPGAVLFTWTSFNSTTHYAFPQGNPFSGTSGAARAQFGYAAGPNSRGQLVDLEYPHYDADTNNLRANGMRVTYRPEDQFLGMSFQSGLTSQGPVYATIANIRLSPWRTLAVPYFYLAVVFAVAPLVRGARLPREWRRARRVALGQCTRCGYDLRGTRAIGRCPECGTPSVGGGPTEPISPPELAANTAETVPPAAAPDGAAARWAAFVRGCVVAVACAVFFSLALFLYTRGNDFPFHYHPWEKWKGIQLVLGERTYNHPLLLMETTDSAMRWAGAPRDLRPAVETGRGVSATFAALAVAALAVAGYRVAGWSGMVLAGLAVALCPPVLVHAHYFKEDAPLVAGLCLAVAAATLTTARHPAGRAVAVLLLGVACGFAASANYAGIYALLFALPFVWFAVPRDWYFGPGTRCVLLLLGFVLVVRTVNHRAANNIPAVQRAVATQWNLATNPWGGTALLAPNSYFARAALRDSAPHVLLAAAACAALPFAARRRESRQGIPPVAVFTAGYLLLLCWCTAPSRRYALPVVVLLHFLAAVGAARVAYALPARWARHGKFLIPTAFAAAVLAIQLPRCLAAVDDFNDDARMRLRQWMAKNLPADAVVAQDAAVCLDDNQAGGWAGRWPGQEPWRHPPVAVRQRIVTPSVLATELGVVAKLTRSGVTHVAVTDAAWGRYFDPHLGAPGPGHAEYAWRRAWYEELFRDHELLWEYRPQRDADVVTTPEIRLYRLRTSKPAAGTDGGGS